MKRQLIKSLFLLVMLAVGWPCVVSKAVAQLDSFDLNGFDSPSDAPISAEAVIVAARGDQPAILVVTASIEEGYKTY